MVKDLKQFITQSVMRQWLIVTGLGVLVFGSYFAKLFFPVPKIFFTPDYYRSDIWFFNYPLKDLLHQSLRQGTLPFWTDNIGTGFPVLAESQIGALFVPNIILFGLLPTWLGWNLMHVFVFLNNYLGTVYLQRVWKISWLSAVVASLVYTLSGFFVMHIIHPNMLATASLFPWIWGLTIRLLEKPQKKLVALLAVLLSQQLCAGYYQMSFITLIVVATWAIFSLWKHKNIPKKNVAWLVTGIFLGLAGSAPQLLPTYELWQSSVYQDNNPLIFETPYPLQHFISWLLPNYFGQPSNGSYPDFGKDWGVYWENTFYIGVIPLLLGLATLIKGSKKSSTLKSLSHLGFICALLALGKYSPISFVFSWPGFGSFRPPTRFFLIVALAVCIAFAHALDKLWRRRQWHLLTGVIVVVAVIDIWLFGFGYHPLIAVKAIESKPVALAEIPTQGRFFTWPTQKLIWSDTYKSQGWQDISDYVYLSQTGGANSNLLWDLNQIDFYSGLFTKRQWLLYSSLSKNFVNISGANYIVSPTALTLPNWQISQIITPPKPGLPELIIYSNPEALDRFRLTTQTIVEPDLQKARQLLHDDHFDYKNLAFIETQLSIKPDKIQLPQPQVVVSTDTITSLQINTPVESLLVVADTYYPGWQATLDGKTTTIHPVNINQRGIVVPSGEHLVTFKYVPTMFYTGLLIALAVWIMTIFWYFKDSLPSKFGHNSAGN